MTGPRPLEVGLQQPLLARSLVSVADVSPSALSKQLVIGACRSQCHWVRTEPEKARAWLSVLHGAWMTTAEDHRPATAARCRSTGGAACRPRQKIPRGRRCAWLHAALVVRLDVARKGRYAHCRCPRPAAQTAGCDAWAVDGKAQRSRRQEGVPAVDKSQKRAIVAGVFLTNFGIAAVWVGDFIGLQLQQEGQNQWR